jgi:hypothetical protein
MTELNTGYPGKPLVFTSCSVAMRWRRERIARTDLAASLLPTCGNDAPKTAAFIGGFAIALLAVSTSHAQTPPQTDESSQNPQQPRRGGHVRVESRRAAGVSGEHP